MATGTLQKNMVLLWENASPTSDFAAQTVAFNTSDYNYFLVKFQSSASASEYDVLINHALIEKGKETALTCFVGQEISSSGTNKYSEVRNITIAATGATFTSAYSRQWNTTSGTNTVYVSKGVMPLKIYGIKA